ncbi:MAG: SseB family protein [Bulleidia sp.]
MRNTRRFMALALAVFSGFSFAFFALIAMNMVLDDEMDGMIFAVVIMMIDIGVIAIANHMHDEVPVKSLKSRWTANTLFFTMIMMVMDSLLYMLNHSYISDSRAALYELCYVFAVVLAVQMYRKNYHRLFPDRERIIVLSNRRTRHLNRRMVFVVTGSTTQKGLCYCEGILNGRVKMLDRLYVYDPKGNMIGARVVHILKDGTSVSATDHRENVTLVLNLRKSVPVYSVLSDVRQGFEEIDENNAENPRVVGLSMAFSKCYHDRNYLDALISSVISARFIVPARVQLEGRANICEKLPPDTNVSVPSVSRTDRADEKILPVFTDWSALSRWEPFVSDSNSCTMLIDYEKLLDLYEGNFSGIVINPFSNESFFMGEDLIGLLKSVRRSRAK